MKTKISLLAFVALATVLGCITPVSTGDISMALLQSNRKAPDMLLATKTPTRRPTKTPTRRPTRTPTRTPLPPLPDFEKVISFSTGAGCGLCCEYENNQPSPNYLSASGRSSRITACFWLWGFDPNQPFRIAVDQLSGPANVHLQSPELFVDLNEGVTLADGRSNVRIWSSGIPEWERPRAYFGELYVGNDGVVAGKFNLWSPVRLAPGSWRLSILQQNSTFGVLSSDFTVEAYNGSPAILTQSARSRSLLQPMSGDFTPYHLIALRSGKIDVSGIKFPANQPIYLLVYRRRGDPEMELVSKQRVQATGSGSVSAVLSGSFEPGMEYLLIALTNPNTSLANQNIASSSLPLDLFRIEGSSPSLSAPASCPGAPPQRMVVNRRGYVCTQGDNVRLRSAPARSASAVVSLRVNSGFSVVGGPACADNWSWWQIQTDDGYSGWISEGGDAIDPYFICPSP